MPSKKISEFTNAIPVDTDTFVVARGGDNYGVTFKSIANQISGVTRIIGDQGSKIPLSGIVHVSGDGCIYVTDNGSDSLIVSGECGVNNAANIGLGSGLFSGFINQVSAGGKVMQLKSLSAGNNISITGDAENLFISSSDSMSGINIGVGSGILSSIADAGDAQTMQFKSLEGGTNIKITGDVSTLYVNTSDCFNCEHQWLLDLASKLAVLQPSNFQSYDAWYNGGACSPDPGGCPVPPIVVVSNTPTPTPTVTPTISVTSTPSPPVSASVSVTPTISVTPSVSITSTPSVTATPTISVTSTPSTSVGLSASVTPTISVTSSVSPTSTPSSTVGVSASPTPSVSPTSTPSITVTPTISVTSSVTPSPSNNPALSSTPTASVTPTISVTPTVTPSISVTPSNTVTPTISVTSTPSNTVTPTISITSTPSTSVGISATPSNTVTPTISVTSSVSVTPSNTVTPTISVTPSSSGPSLASCNSNDFQVVCEGGKAFPAIPVFGGCTANISYVSNSASFMPFIPTMGVVNVGALQGDGQMGPLSVNIFGFGGAGATSLTAIQYDGAVDVTIQVTYS